MNFNLTILGQMIAFAIFVWFCMKYVWPFIITNMHEREQRIRDGLAASEDAANSLAQAEKDSEIITDKAKKEAAAIIDQANKRGGQIVEEAKIKANEEGDRIIHGAQAEITQQTSQARESLRGEVSKLAVLGASKILEKEVDAKAHSDMLDELAQQL